MKKTSLIFVAVLFGLSTFSAAQHRSGEENIEGALEDEGGAKRTRALLDEADPDPDDQEVIFVFGDPGLETRASTDEDFTRRLRPRELDIPDIADVPAVDFPLGNIPDEEDAFRFGVRNLAKYFSPNP